MPTTSLAEYEPDAAAHELTVADLAAKFGSLPAWRIRTDVPPGTATEDDVERIRCKTDVLCELIDGVLVEKVSTNYASFITMEIGCQVANFVRTRRMGWILGPDGFLWVTPTRLLAPDFSFIRKQQWPDGPSHSGFGSGPPALAVEVFSPGNTRQEMEEKRAEYFASGSELVWIVFPKSQTIEVATSPDKVITLGRDDTLSGEPVLPGFAVKVSQLFEVDDLGDERQAVKGDG